jgi:TRAP-type C4-dicarboxylate transport system permease small subunit
VGFMNKILSVVISVAFFVLVVVTFAQVVFRYLIGYSLYWSEEAARYLFVWISFLGSVIALQKGVHIGFDVCVKKLPPTLMRYTLLFGDLAVLAFLVFITYQGFVMAEQNMIQQSAALEIPMGVVMMAVPIGFALMAVCTLSQMIKRFRMQSTVKVGER